MEAITAEVITGEKKRDERGHRLYDEEGKRRIMEGYDKSGLTQRAYAKQEGIKYSTLVSWLQGRRRARGQTKSLMKFEELGMPMTGMGGSLEVVLADGTLVRGTSARALAELINLLRA
jgi:DNA-binding transcriptional regulator YiaG